MGEVFATVLVTTIAILLLTRKPLRTPLRILISALWLCLLYHALAEGPHWQLAPIYLAAMLVTISPLRERERLDLGTACLILTGASAVLSHCIPMFQLPRPTGAFATGTRIFYVTDPSQRESDGHPRELVVQAWYPADCSRHAGWIESLFPYLEKAPYRRWKEVTARSSYHMFAWTNSCLNGNVHAGTYPVLLVNAGMTGRRTQTTFITEELASHGYIALAIDHPYSTGPVELSDGRVVQVALNPIDATEAGRASSDAQYRKYTEAVDHETTDTLFLLNHLSDWQSDQANLLHGHLDLTKIGATGYSLGGSVAAELAARDARIRAVFDMSGRLFASVRERSLDVPFFYLCETMRNPSAPEFAQMPPEDRTGVSMERADMAVLQSMLANHGGYYLQLPTGNHAIFSDQTLFSPYPRFGGADPKKTKTMQEVIRAYAVGFFDDFLKGEQSALLQQPPALSDTVWKIYPQPEAGGETNLGHSN